MNELVATVEERLYKTSITVEERSATEGGGKFFVGTGIVFNQPSRPLYDQKRGVFQEIIEPGAIDDDTDLSEVLAVFNHDENRLLGANYSGTLSFKTTETGVDVRILKPENTVGNDCEVWVNRGDIRGMSFKFFVAKDRWETKDNVLYRYVEKISKLMDLSLVTRAAYLQTTIGVAASTRSYAGISAEEATTRGLYMREKKQLNDNDQAFLTGMVAQLQTQIDFVSQGIPKLTDKNVKRLAAGRLSDLIYSQSWIEETIAELQEAVVETPETPVDAERSAKPAGEAATQQPTTENPETRSAESSENIQSEETQGHSLDWYKAKNTAHRNSL
ncbi:HK97 family phage prohead protease [Spirosoma agri]|uniref:HK97 family phage prohead protease n=1 Tax=Spirosoma agri TaxID=1987381 RepID=A0A6M0IJ72_9BACT|nr:HK97 family phage prohead protease [Spirosoma agri]NEU68319.1 HK97 family phage prohead protease [Spirosoma agri]